MKDTLKSKYLKVTHLLGCPHGWRMFDGYCYKFINSRQKKTIAIQRCHQEKHGAIVSPAESEAETNLLRDMAYVSGLSVFFFYY